MPGQGVWLPQCIEPPTRDDFWPGYKAVLHSFILAFHRSMTLSPYIPPPPLDLSILFPCGSFVKEWALSITSL